MYYIESPSVQKIKSNVSLSDCQVSSIKEKIATLFWAGPKGFTPFTWWEGTTKSESAISIFVSGWPNSKVVWGGIGLI